MRSANGERSALAADREILELVRAAPRAVSSLRRIERGEWRPLRSPSVIGWLVLDGVIARRVAVNGGGCCELIGGGDVVRPWEAAEGAGSVGARVRWRVIEPAVVVRLNSGVATPEASRLLDCLCNHAVSRAQRLAVQVAIASQVGIDRRVSLMLRHLADRWGRVCRDGVVLPVRLSHGLLAQMVCARRPTVTTALGELTRSGKIERLATGGWLLRAAGQDGADADSSILSRSRTPA